MFSTGAEDAASIQESNEKYLEVGLYNFKIIWNFNITVVIYLLNAILAETYEGRK